VSTRLTDHWATRFGLIMAMAGNAVGLGNFLRFPGQAAPYGGAFMVPYLIALILMGIPLMWIEWTIGRHGGRYGHGSTPGMFYRLWKHPISKYLGIFGVLLPAIIGIYYIYIESWALGFTWKTITGEYWGMKTREEMQALFAEYRGLDGSTLSFGMQAYFFFLITLALNLFIFSRGISRGIEIVARFAMPTLLIIGAILAIRVLTLPPREATVSEGMAHIWVIDWSVLKSSDVWLAATGQIFFTLSLGFGMIHTYASYLRRNDDLTLNGLSAVGTNTFVEVILGGTIAIPAAVVFFGAAGMHEIREGGSFDIAFFALPLIFQELPAGQLFGTLWFFLLFLAGLTSSVAMFMPLLLFMQDELRMSHKKSLILIGVSIFLLMQPVILFLHRGVLDELDYWAGTFFLVVFAAIEAVVFAWFFGMKKGWKEMHEGSDFQVPRIFYYIMLYVTPVFTLSLLGWWVFEVVQTYFTGAHEVSPDAAYHWLARGIILLVGLFLFWGVWHAWRTHPKFFETHPVDLAEQELEEQGE